MIWLTFFTIHTTASVIVIFILGAIIGSFLNVVIYRYPIMLTRQWNAECMEQLKQPVSHHTATFNLWIPRSHCPHCKHTLPFWLNTPILSYLILNGKCGFCREKISIQYFLVEILTAMLSVAVFLQFGITWQTVALLIFTWGLIASSCIDIQYQFLPDTITYSLLWLGLLLSTQHLLIDSTEAIMGASIGYLFLFSTFLALMISVVLLLFKKLHKGSPISFGPYLAIAGWYTALY